MQPAFMEYESCDENGLTCWSAPIEDVLENDQMTTAISVTEESNFNLLLNIDHFYRNQCSNELGIVNSVPKELLNAWRACLINKMEKMIQARNKENLEYLKNIKDSFDQD